MTWFCRLWPTKLKKTKKNFCRPLTLLCKIVANYFLAQFVAELFRKKRLKDTSKFAKRSAARKETFSICPEKDWKVSMQFHLQKSLQSEKLLNLKMNFNSVLRAKGNSGTRSVFSVKVTQI